MKSLRALMLGAALLSGLTPALAADPSGDAGFCVLADGSNLITIESNADLQTQVVSMMDEAVAAANDPRWVDSGRPVFVWASEAKVACGKAYGYLKTNYRDEDYLNKCECFHNRMLEYMN